MKNINIILFTLLVSLILFSNSAFSTKQNITKKGEALFTAIADNDLKAVKKLVEKKKADVNYVRRMNKVFFIPVLMQAVMSDNTEIATYLITKGADVNARDGFKMTCLMWAANNGNVPLVKTLLENGADKEAADDNGLTALKAAQDKGYKEVIKLLDK